MELQTDETNHSKPTVTPGVYINYKYKCDIQELNACDLKSGLVLKSK